MKIKIFFFFLFTIPIFSLKQFSLLKPNKNKFIQPDCSNHGYFYNKQCFCQTQYFGKQCEQKNNHIKSFHRQQKCTYLIDRLDRLFNISPDNYENDDDEFSRFSGKSIGTEVYDGNRNFENNWIRMHNLTDDFIIYNKTVKPKTIAQGEFGDCYLLAALASMANIYGGEIIKNLFMTKRDNKNHVYVTRWLVAGKPRYVAVDDWIPGEGQKTYFSQLKIHQEFWAIILEKAWAKINGDYFSTEGGDSIEIFEALLQCSTENIQNSKSNKDQLFSEIQKNLINQYPSVVNTHYQSTYKTKFNITKKRKLIPNHQYSILRAYQVEKDDGSKQKLIQVFNPWNKEKWVDNPWGGKGKNWSENMKKKYNINSMDGAFHLTPEDFIQEFELTTYCSYRKGYLLSWIDVPFTSDLSTYKIEFLMKNQQMNEVFLKFQQQEQRFLKDKNCLEPFYLLNMKIYDPDNIIINEDQDVDSYQLYLKKEGKYKVEIQVQRYVQQFKYFTFTLLAKENNFEFIKQNETQIEAKENNCPKNCSGNGKCNNLNGKCKCNPGFIGLDCSKPNKFCPKNCNGNGKCDLETLQCICNDRTFDKDCKQCDDQINCENEVQNGACELTKGFLVQYIEENCPYSCAKLGIEKYARCL